MMRWGFLRMSFALLLLAGTRGRAASPIGPVDAVAQACAAPEVRERLGQSESLRITAEFVEQWSVWIVQFFQDDRRVAFSTVSPAGEVKEIGPGESESAEANIASETRRRELLHELEAAQEAGNEAEVREISELLERLETPIRVGGRRTDATSRVPTQSTLPVYEISLPEEGVRRMLAEVTEEITVRGELGFDGDLYPVEVRLRGASTRHAAKKSYRVRFLEGSPLPRKVTYFKAEPMDHTMQQEKLSCDVFRAAGARVSDADYISLFLNGRYEGVYLDIEPIRSPFKKKPGLDPKGTLIRADTFQHLVGRETLGEARFPNASAIANPRPRPMPRSARFFTTTQKRVCSSAGTSGMDVQPANGSAIRLRTRRWDRS